MPAPSVSKKHLIVLGIAAVVGTFVGKDFLGFISLILAAFQGQVAI